MEYPVPADNPAAETLRRMQAEIDELKAARNMMATVMKGGTFELREETAGRRMLRFGSFGDAIDGTPLYGIVMYDENGSQVFVILDDQRGIVYPHDAHGWMVPTSQPVSAAAGWQVVAHKLCVLPPADVLQAEGAIVTPIGSTAQVRIRDANHGDSTAVLEVPEGRTARAVFEWQHPFSVGWGDTAHPHNSPLLQWEVRVSSGPGPVTATPPSHLTFRNKRFLPLSTTDGGGRLT